jgi:hypothetical protein
MIDHDQNVVLSKLCPPLVHAHVQYSCQGRGKIPPPPPEGEKIIWTESFGGKRLNGRKEKEENVREKGEKDKSPRGKTNAKGAKN